MSNFIKTKTPLLIVCLIFLLFNILFFVCVPLQDGKAGVWIGYSFIVVSFLIFGGLAGFFHLKSKNTLTTIWPLMYSTSGYFVLSLILNIILIIVNSENVTVGIVLNVVLLIFYAIAFLISFKSFLRVSDNTERREARVNELRSTEIKVNSLSFLTSDTEIKQAILKFKENVSYSSSAKTEEMEEYDQQLDEAIETIKQLLTTECGKDSILKAIEKAEQILKVRNQTLMVSRK